MALELVPALVSRVPVQDLHAKQGIKPGDDGNWRAEDEKTL